MCQWTGSALVHVMAWCRTGIKPLTEPMLTYNHLNPFIDIWIEILTFLFRNTRFKMSSAKWRPFCPGGDALSCKQGSHDKRTWVIDTHVDVHFSVVISLTRPPFDPDYSSDRLGKDYSGSCCHIEYNTCQTPNLTQTCWSVTHLPNRLENWKWIGSIIGNRWT